MHVHVHVQATVVVLLYLYTQSLYIMYNDEYNTICTYRSIGELKRLQKLDLGNNEIEALVG